MPSSPHSDRRQRIAERWALTVAIFASFFDTFAMLPVLPVYLRGIGAEAWQIGLVMSTYSLVGLLTQVAGGYVADTFGRKRPLVASLIGTSVVLGLYGALPSVWWLATLRVFHGVLGAFSLPALFALIGEQAGGQRVKAMGYAGATIGLAAIVAPPIGGILAQHFGAPILFASVAALMALAALLVWQFVPETLVLRAESKSPQPLTVLRVPLLVVTYLLTASFTFCMGTLAYTLPLLLVERGHTTATAGQLLGWMALVSVPIMALFRRGQPLERALLGLGLIAACLAVLWKLHPLWSLGIAMGVYGIGFGLVFPALHVLVAEHAPASLRGSAFALLYVFYSAGIIAGPIVAGLVTSFLPPGAVAAAITAATLLAVVGWRVRERRMHWVRA
ncbi:MAG: MFS transporter [Chlorobiota bacterium]